MYTWAIISFLLSNIFRANWKEENDERARVCVWRW